MTDLEKKHTPVIDAPEVVKKGECFTVNIETGKLLAHPNERGHYIHFLELYADETFLVRVDLSAVTTCPTATLCLALEGPASELRAYERCNLHGIWKNAKAIQVAE